MSGQAKIHHILVYGTDQDYFRSARHWMDEQPTSVRYCSALEQLHKELKKPDLPDLLLIDETSFEDVVGLLASDEELEICRPLVCLAKHDNHARHKYFLDLGASDVINRDMPGELVVSILNRRMEQLHTWSQLTGSQKHRLQFGDLVVDNLLREAWLLDQPIELTGAEFDLLWLLCSHAGQIMTREEIFYRLRGIEYDGQDRSVDVRVSRIRPKVGDDPVHPRRIKTIRSKGYLFVPDGLITDSLDPAETGIRH